MHLKNTAFVVLGALASLPAYAQTPPDSVLNPPPLYKTQPVFPTDLRTGMTAGLLLQRMPNSGAVSSSTGQITLTSPDGTAYALTGDVRGSAALLASPAFTGIPTAPTAAAGTNTTQVATTAFVAAANSAELPSATTSQLYGGSGGAGVASSLSLSSLFSIASSTFGMATQPNGTLLANISGSVSAPSFSSMSSVLDATTSNVNGRVLCRASGLWTGGTPGTCGVASLASPGTFSGTMAVPQPPQNDDSAAPATTGFVTLTKPCVSEIAGRAYPSQGATFGTTPALGTTTVQPVTATPIIVCNPPGPVTRLAFEITTATATAFNARMAIYADNNGLPGGSPLADSGTFAIAASATGMLISTLASPVTLPGPGIYWLTFESSYLAAPATLRGISSGGPGALVAGLGYALTSGATSTSGQATAIYANQAFGAPPSSFALTGYEYANTITPLVWMGY